MRLNPDPFRFASSSALAGGAAMKAPVLCDDAADPALYV
jgi:hypothetical protein